MGGSTSIIASTKFFTKANKFGQKGYLQSAARWDPNELNVPMNGKKCVVTGANSGLGYEVALALSKLGAKVTLVCRNPARGEEARESIAKESNNEHVQLLVCDVSRPAAVRILAQTLVDAQEPVDVLVNNAGVLLEERTETEDGLEATFATNSLATFLLTEYLLPIIPAGGRIINVASGGMYTVKMNDDYANEREGYSGLLAYSQTKRHQVYLAQKWASLHKDKGVLFFSMHPGWARTPGTQNSLPKFFDSLALRTAQQGADTIVYLSVCNKVESLVNGGFYLDREITPLDLVKSTASNQVEIDNMYAYFAQYLDEEGVVREPAEVSAEKLEEYFQELRNSDHRLEASSHKFVGKKFNDVFKGTEFIEWMRANRNLNKKEAKMIGVSLIKSGYITHTSSNILGFTASCFYKYLK